uniref:Vesicle-fusing ATPase n=1 Tax=Timema bartmani TaxID=61472 RepID=A0A7R9HXH4_9NEOP|nr:unnamed protein product [Timema bartmani]
MNTSLKLKEAISTFTRAIEQDNKRNYEYALNMYLEGVQLMIEVSRYEGNSDYSREVILSKCSHYLDRAELLKTYLLKRNHQADVSSKQSETEDVETNLLQGKLEGVIVEKDCAVTWSDVVDLEDVKEALEEAVILPLKFPQLFTGMRKTWKGILLFGPPGTGKTLLAKALASEAKASTFISVSSSDLVSKWFGESEKMVKNLFKLARSRKPSIIFIDEVDSLCSNRSSTESDATRRIKTEFLVQMEGVNSNNEGLTDMYSGADINILVREATMQPIRKILAATHFRRVTGRCPVNPSVMLDDLLTPCRSKSPDAIPMDWQQVPSDKLVEPLVTMDDMRRALVSSKATVTAQDLRSNSRFDAILRSFSTQSRVLPPFELEVASITDDSVSTPQEHALLNRRAHALGKLDQRATLGSPPNSPSSTFSHGHYKFDEKPEDTSPIVDQTVNERIV